MQQGKQKYLTELGNKLKQRRQQKGMTLLDLSVESGISRRQLIRIEQGEANPTIYHFKSLCRVLDINPNELLGI